MVMFTVFFMIILRIINNHVELVMFMIILMMDLFIGQQLMMGQFYDNYYDQLMVFMKMQMMKNVRSMKNMKNKMEIWLYYRYWKGF